MRLRCVVHGRKDDPTRQDRLGTRGGEHFGAVITGSVQIRPDLAAFRTEPVIMAVGWPLGPDLVPIPTAATVNHQTARLLNGIATDGVRGGRSGCEVERAGAQTCRSRAAARRGPEPRPGRRQVARPATGTPPGGEVRDRRPPDR